MCIVFMMTVTKLYDEVWEGNRQAKIAREEREAREKAENNMETRSILEQQIAAHEEMKQQAAMLKEEEQRLRVECYANVMTHVVLRMILCIA